MSQNEAKKYNEIEAIFCAIADVETEYKSVYINDTHDEKSLRGVILNYASDRIIFITNNTIKYGILGKKILDCLNL